MPLTSMSSDLVPGINDNRILTFNYKYIYTQTHTHEIFKNNLHYKLLCLLKQKFVSTVFAVFFFSKNIILLSGLKFYFIVSDLLEPHFHLRQLSVLS